MRRSRLWAIDDAGSAALEFITVGVILLVPLVYLVIALGAIQEQSLGAEAAARQTARVIAQAPNADAAADRGDVVLAAVIDEYGIDADEVEMSVSCIPTGVACPSAGATLLVTVAVRVPLPLVPGILGLDRSTAVPVQADAVQKVSRQWGSE